MDKKLEHMRHEDVVSTYSDPIFVKNRTFMVSELTAALVTAVKRVEQGWTQEKEKWFDQGIDCEILKPGAKGWRRGKVRFTLEFCPEEFEIAETPESSKPQANEVASPLDELRQMINQDSQQGNSLEET